MADVMNVYQPFQPSQQQQMSPLQVLQLIGQINQNKLFNQEYEARQNIGNAYRDNTLPNGEINTPGLRSQIGQTGGFRAGEGLQQATSNSAADVALKSTYAQTLRSIFGQLATKPVITAQDISQAKAAAAAQGVPGGIIQEFASSIPRVNSKKDQDSLKDWATSQSNLARGPEATAAPVTVQTPNGPVQYSEGAVARARNGGGAAIGLAPGQTEQIETPKKVYLSDQEKSATTQANLRQLETVYPLIKQLGSANFGPGSEGFAKVKGALITAGVIDPNTSDATVRQEANKYMLKYARGAQDAGRSDHALSAAIGSNPNLDLTQPANLSLIRNQIGMDKADAAIPVLFDKLYPGDANKKDYQNFKTNFYRNYDQRAFAYDKMSPDERRQLIDSLGPKNSPAYKKFAQTYSELKSAKFINPNGQ